MARDNSAEVAAMYSDHTGVGGTKSGSGDLERKRLQRLRFMTELYDMVDGFDAQPVQTRQIAARLGFDASRPEGLLDVLKLVHYLHGEGLLVASGPSGEATSLTLTHKGVREVEESRSRPTLPTEHFPALDAIEATLSDRPSSDHNGKAKAAGLTTLAETDRLEVLRMTRSLQEWADRLALDEDQRAEYDADIRTIEAQLDSPRPKAQLIKVALQSIKSTAENANSSPGSAGSIVSSGIASTIDRFVSRF
jgi:hypothetical protein